MNNDSKEPLKGKELRDLARSEPAQALIYLENNKDHRSLLFSKYIKA